MQRRRRRRRVRSHRHRRQWVRVRVRAFRFVVSRFSSAVRKVDQVPPAVRADSSVLRVVRRVLAIVLEVRILRASSRAELGRWAATSG